MHVINASILVVFSIRGRKKKNHAVSLKCGSLQFVALCFFTEIGMEIIDLSVSGLSVSDVEWEIKLWN